MGEVLDINANKPHRYSEVICVGCGKRWIAVRPATELLKDIVCENCGAGKVIETGEQNGFCEDIK